MSPPSGSKPATGGNGTLSRTSYLIGKIKQGSRGKWQKDELKTVLHWLKQLAALALGCAFGAAGVTGGYAFLAYLTLSTFLTVTFYRNILGVDEDEFGGATELMMEGFAPAVAVFLLLWILGFTALAAPR